MKIEGSFTGAVNPRQSKPAKEAKAPETVQTGGGISDEVDVAASAYSSQAAPVESHGEALNLTETIDYQKAIDAHNIPQESAFQLASLMQA